MLQAEADTELTLSASPTTAVGQKALALAKRCYSTVKIIASFASLGCLAKCLIRVSCLVLSSKKKWCIMSPIVGQFFFVHILPKSMCSLCLEILRPKKIGENVSVMKTLHEMVLLYGITCFWARGVVECGSILQPSKLFHKFATLYWNFCLQCVLTYLQQQLR